MKEKIKFSLIIITLVSCLSCEDILEVDISGDQIQIANPLEGELVEGNTVQFLWNELEGANAYSIQIYKGNILLEDTLVKSPPYTKILSTDGYGWRIKGQNEAYETQYTFPANFEVVETSNLENQNVILTSPSNNLYTNDNSLIFTWMDVPLAETYTFELEKILTTGSTVIYIDSEIMITTLTLDNSILEEDAEYLWRVRAENSTSQTQFFSRTFFIDTVNPTTPVLITPLFEEEFVLADIIEFSWSFNEDPGSIDSTITSYYEIALDEDFNNLIESSTSFDTMFNRTFSDTGTYYWRVRGDDAAGNSGTFNSDGKFIVNE